MILNNIKLLVIIVNEGLGSKIVSVAKKSGSRGGTIIRGRGVADKNMYESILGVRFEPEKEIVLIAVDEATEESILKIITNKLKLDEPGKGIAFVINLKKMTGISNLMKPRMEVQ